MSRSWERRGTSVMFAGISGFCELGSALLYIMDLSDISAAKSQLARHLLSGTSTLQVSTPTALADFYLLLQRELSTKGTRG